MYPNRCLIVTIQLPILGKSLPADVPMIKRGVPIPMLIENSAIPPLKIFPVSLMTISEAINGGATQAVTINDEMAPIKKVPA